jgi:hypothetical protein
MIGVVARDGDRDVVVEFFELFKTPWEFARGDAHYDVLIRTDGALDLDYRSARLVIAYGSSPSSFDRETTCIPGAQRHDAMLSRNGERIPVYGPCLPFPSAAEAADLVLEDSGIPVAAVTRRGGQVLVRIGYDLFGEVRTLLTRGQPPIHATIPALERHIAFLRDVIVDAGIPLMEIPPIPEGHRFIACLTHDVDHPAVRLHRFDHTMLGFLYRAVVGSLIGACRSRTPLKTLWRNWAAALRLPFVHLGLARDFWSQFDRYLEIEQGLGSTFFVIPAKRDPGRTVNGRAPRIRASSYGVADIADRVKVLCGAGAEVGLHGLDAWLDSGAARSERERVSRVTGASTSGVRMHWLFFDEQSPSRLDEGGFVYDSTFGYNDTVGFKAGTLQAFKPLSARRLLELPLTIMDTALFYPSHLNLTPDAAKQVVWRLVDDAERYGGALVINWHDRSLAPERLWGDFYMALLEELRRRRAWCPTASEAAAWFSQRRSVAFASRPDGETVQIRVTADGRHDVPGLRVRVYEPRTPDQALSPRGRRPLTFTDLPLTQSQNACVTIGAA